MKRIASLLLLAGLVCAGQARAAIINMAIFNALEGNIFHI